MDYYPYGGARIDTKYGDYGGEKRKYAGTEKDELSGLNFMQARYQNPTWGRFVSQDPVFWEKQNLLDPQSLNSYSYANGNPINKSDPNGRSAVGAPMGPWGMAFMMLFSPIQGSYDPVYEPAQYAAQNDSTAKILDTAVGLSLGGGKGGRVAPNGRLVNYNDGVRREAEVFSDLQKSNPGADIVKQPYLRDASGNIVKDTKFGEGRRIDNAVVQNGKVIDRVEVTSQTANKSRQVKKEENIISNGGTFIRGTDGTLINFANQTGGVTTPARIIRKP